MNLNELIGDLYNSGREKITDDVFNQMIISLNLKPTYNILLDNFGDVVINEEWSSLANRTIKANRIYKFDPSVVDMIQVSDRKSVLTDVLDTYVNNEDYEMASIIRDIIVNL